MKWKQILVNNIIRSISVESETNKDKSKNLQNHLNQQKCAIDVLSGLLYKTNSYIKTLRQADSNQTDEDNTRVALVSATTDVNDLSTSKAE